MQVYYAGYGFGLALEAQNTEGRKIQLSRLDSKDIDFLMKPEPIKWSSWHSKRHKYADGIDWK